MYRDCTAPGFNVPVREFGTQHTGADAPATGDRAATVTGQTPTGRADAYAPYLGPPAGATSAEVTAAAATADGAAGGADRGESGAGPAEARTEAPAGGEGAAEIRMDGPARAAGLPPNGDARMDALFDESRMAGRAETPPDRVHERLAHANHGLLPAGALSGEQAMHAGFSEATPTGRVFFTGDQYTEAKAGAENIITDAALLQPEPDGSFVVMWDGEGSPAARQPMSADDVGKLLLHDRGYTDGTDIKMNRHLSLEDADDLAAVTNATVQMPPPDHIARADADGRLVIVPADRYGLGGGPYPPSGTADSASWVAHQPPDRVPLGVSED